MYRFAWLVLCLAAIPAWAEPPTVTTSRGDARTLPLPKGEDAFHFVVFGDRTGGPAAGIEVLRRAVRETNLLDPDLVMTVGDLVQGYTGSRNWLLQMREYRGVMDALDMPWFPVAGNHDIYWGGSKPPPGHHESNYEKHFGPLWYWFAHKRCAFVVLYSDEGDAQTNRRGWRHPSVNRFSERQLSWLSKTLQETKSQEHVFVFLHHPRWRTDYYPDSNWSAVHECLAAAGNVSAVFAGHMHRRRYHGRRDGIEYFTLAAVGGGMPFNVPGTGHLHHMDVVSVRKDGFKIATIPVGSVLDPREMTPERLQEIDTVRSLPLVLSGGPFEVTRGGASIGACTLPIANPCSRAIEVTARLSARDPGWRLQPNHGHARIEPDEKHAFAFRYERRAGEGLEHIRVPHLDVQVEYLGPTTRVALPLRIVPFPLRLTGIPDDFFERLPNRALSLGGRESLVVPADRVPVPDGPLTVEGRLKAVSYGGRRGFIAKTEQSDYGLFVSNGQPGFSVFLGNRYVEAKGKTGQLEPGRWYHLAGVFDGSEVRLYVDGALIARSAGTGSRRQRPLPLVIGGDVDGLERPMSFVRGLVDEVRVSRTARYAGQRFEPVLRHKPDEATVLLLHLDGGVGAFAVDHSPAARHIPAGRQLRYVDLDEAEGVR